MEKEFVPDDLGSLIGFVCEAQTTQASNKSRTQAAVAGKETAFRNGKWNKPVPFGYSKVGTWVQKRPELEPVITELFKTFTDTGNLATTTTSVNARYSAVMEMSLSRDRVRKLLADPVYLGRPVHMSATKDDPSLQMVDEVLFEKAAQILAEIASVWRPTRTGPLEKLADEDPITLLKFLEQVDLVDRGCGGKITKNGIDKKTDQQLFRCAKCSHEFRVPTRAHIGRGEERSSLEQESEKKLQASNRTPSIKPATGQVAPALAFVQPKIPALEFVSPEATDKDLAKVLHVGASSQEVWADDDAHSWKEEVPARDGYERAVGCPDEGQERARMKEAAPAATTQASAPKATSGKKISGWASLKLLYPNKAAVEKKLQEPNLRESYKKILNDLKRYWEKHP